MAASAQRSKIDQIWPSHPTNHISARYLNPVRQIWTKFGMDIQLYLPNKPAQEFLIYRKIQDDRRELKSQIDQIWPHKSHLGSAFGSRSSDLDKIGHEHTSWPYKWLCARIYQLAQNPRWLPAVKGPKSSKFDPTNPISARHLDLIHQIWTKFVMNILLDPTNKFAHDFIR